MSAISSCSSASFSPASANSLKADPPIPDRLYSPERLLQLAASRGSQSNISESASLLQLHMQRFAADILIESGNSTSGSSHHSSSSSEDEDETEEIDDGFVYGQGAIRTDLSFELIEQLRTFVHQTLDEQPLTSSKPAPVLVSTTTTTAVPRTFVYNHSSNPRGVFGTPRNLNRPRALSRSRPTGFTRTPNPNADRDSSWRGRAEKPSVAVVQESMADSQNWRRVENGSRWAWTDNRYQVVKA